MHVTFAAPGQPKSGVLVVFCPEDKKLSGIAAEADKRSGGHISRAMKAIGFEAKREQVLDLVAPEKLPLQRIILLGVGDPAKLVAREAELLGGAIAGYLQAAKTESGTVAADLTGLTLDAAEFAALLASGATLRTYSFDRYKSKKPGNGKGLTAVTILTGEAAKAKKAFADYEAVANGVNFARDLVNEPANVLGPVEFAERVKELERVGVEVEILDVDALSALKMGALLCVGQGSVRPSRVAVMQWHGAKSKRTKPVAFVGKGVTFDTGGISIKPAAGMEDMKGDMGGAACVVGLMYALGERKANVNAVGLIGMVENMPSGSAVRPGDIVTSMSGQTIEVLNTDAEGRLVLADVLWYAQERFKPKLVVDLATLTGAIMIALGKEYAGLFSNDDRLANDLSEAAKLTGEKVWRMPLDKAFDKMIDSRNADVKNLGGRWGGSCTAAAFLQRFIKDTPWAHIDLAGTAMDGARSEINTSWGSGWGVRLLNRLVADHYES
jgi:leucyl aminopeptidase